eukprot:scaffold14885_cov65-Phaeocystis_antarctica.AAC.4
MPEGSNQRCSGAAYRGEICRGECRRGCVQRLRRRCDWRGADGAEGVQRGRKGCAEGVDAASAAGAVGAQSGGAQAHLVRVKVEGGVERCSLEASEVAVDNKGEDSDGRRDHGVGYPLTAVLREACRIQMHTRYRQDVMSRKGQALSGRPAVCTRVE